MTKKTKCLRDFITLIVSFLIVVLLVVAVACSEDRSKNDVLNFATKYDKNRNFALIGDSRVYLSTKTISHNELPEFQVEKFLYVSYDRIYYQTLSDSNKTVFVCCATHDMEDVQILFSKTFKDTPTLYMKDTEYVYIVEDGYFRYDLLTGEYQLLGESLNNIEADFISRKNYLISKSQKGALKNKTEFSITRKADGVTKLLSIEDLLKNSDATALNDLYALNMLSMHSYEDNLYLVCSCHYSVAIIFRYDFDRETIEFYGWREVIDTEGLNVCFWETP